MVRSSGRPRLQRVRQDAVVPTRWILDPDASLAATAGYTVTAVGKTGGVADLAGNPVKTDVVWSFSTGAA